MAARQIRISGKMLFTWFMMAGVIFLFVPQNLTNKFQFAFARMFRWPLSIGKNISLSTHTQQPLKDVVSRREYNKLQNHLAYLNEELIQKQKKIEKLAGLRDKLYVLEGASIMIADVIKTSIDGLQGGFIINQGKNEGIGKNQFVLGDNSIIGRISDVSAQTAKVKLITDPGLKIPVKITGLNVDMLMQGNGNNSAKIKLQKIKHEINIGDIVSVQKIPGFLDAPMITGTVTKCDRDSDNPLLWDITVGPACNLEKLNDVAVIIMNP